MIFTREVSAASSRFGGRHDLVQHPVHPEPHPEDLLVGLQVNVRGPPPDRVHEHHVHQPHHRRLVR